MVQSLHDARSMAKPVDVANNNNAMSIPSHLTGLLSDMIIGINSPRLPSSQSNSRQGRGNQPPPQSQQLQSMSRPKSVDLPNYKVLNNIASSGRVVANNNNNNKHGNNCNSYNGFSSKSGHPLSQVGGSSYNNGHQLHRQAVASPAAKKVKESANHQVHKNRQVRKTQNRSNTSSSILQPSRLVNKVVEEKNHETTGLVNKVVLEEKKEWDERDDIDDLQFLVGNFWKNMPEPLPEWYVGIQRHYPLQNRV